MRRANLGGRRTAGEQRVSRRRRRPIAGPGVARDIGFPVGQYVRNIPISDPYRYGEYTHASDLIYKCMRMVSLAGDLKVPVPTEPNWQSMKLIHAMGHATAAYVTGIVVKQNPNVFGHWKCQCEERIGPVTRKEAWDTICEKCETAFLAYDELTVINEEYNLIGNCDLAWMEGDFLVMTELKSISKTQFDKLTDAKPDHKLQLLLYSWMATELGYQVHPSLSIHYSCREWMIGNPYKEFVVETDVARRVAPLLLEAAAMKRWKEDGTIPDRTWCNRPEDSRAKKCGMCSECFIRD